MLEQLQTSGELSKACWDSRLQLLILDGEPYEEALLEMVSEYERVE